MTRNTDYVMNNSIGLIYFTNTTSQTWITNALNISYSYYIGSYARNMTDDGISGQVQLANFIPTIAIVAIAAVVLGVIVIMFGRRKY